MGMTVRKVTDPAFKAYGRVITGYDFSGLLKAMEHTPLPEDVIYIPSLPEMEALPDAKELERRIYSQMPIQIGCCNGHNKKLNAVEYHRDSEVDIAVDDLILILGKQQDIEEDHTYDTSRMEAFLVPAGTAVEVYATTLHYAPCHVKDEGFRCVIVLPKGTNLDLEPVEVKDPEDRLLFARNKWLIGHAEGGLPEEAFIGLKGENLSV
ncbi:MAG: DUF4867 family protein [Clostridia bacterium]|nr:DUF4867 family protein [Clostridia bacterium]